MPSKKKKYNARFPAVSEMCFECVVRIESTQIDYDDDDD